MKKRRARKINLVQMRSFGEDNRLEIRKNKVIEGTG